MVVVGGGPGGSSFAKHAAEAGLEVVVLDKRKELGSPVRCGEGMSAGWNKGTGFTLDSRAVACEIDGAAVFAPDGRELVLQNKDTKGFVLERKIFDKSLAAQAARAGTHVRPKTIATELLKKDGKPCGVKAREHGEETEFTAQLVVSAEGMEALIARQAGFDALARPYDVDTCFEYELVNVECRPLIELYFGNAAAPRGYAWVFPKGKDVANVGIGVGGHTGADPKKLLDEFIAARPERFSKAEAVEVKGGVISVGAPIPELVKDNFMVVGTAAHQVDPIHGGGMALAIKAGLLAAQTAVQAFEKKDFSASMLSSYAKAWEAAEGERFRQRLLLRKVLEQLSDDDLNYVFKEIDDADLHKVLESDFKPVVAKLLLKRPSLLKVLNALK